MERTRRSANVEIMICQPRFYLNGTQHGAEAVTMSVKTSHPSPILYKTEGVCIVDHVLRW